MMSSSIESRRPWPSAIRRVSVAADWDAAAVVLRILVLKHLHDWSFDECEREVRGSLVYRAFCWIHGERGAGCEDADPAGPPAGRAGAQGGAGPAGGPGARARCVVRGRRLRVDTTVVETNIHYPTDATLLADGVRVLTRTLRRIGGRVRERTRSVARRVFEIAQRSRTAGRRVRPRGPRAEPGEDGRSSTRASCGSRARWYAKPKQQ